MRQSAEQLYKSILFRAGDIYEVDYEDIERDVGQQFDPIVRFMAGALAHELSGVYDDIQASEGRLLHRLAKVMLPEHVFLPTPAHALAMGHATSDPIDLDELVELEAIDAKDEDHIVQFSPVFPQRIMPCRIALIATDRQVIERSRRSSFRQRAGGSGTEHEVQELLLGIQADQAVSDWQGAALYFNLKTVANDPYADTQFYATLKNARCWLQGQELEVKPGLQHTADVVEDYLNGNQRLHERVRARYDRHFISIRSEEVFMEDPINIGVKLRSWFQVAEDDDLSDDVTDALGRLNLGDKQELYWMVVRLERPVSIRQVTSRLEIRLNAFPVVNRRLNGHREGQHHYLRNNAIKWVHIQPDQDFLSIRRVYGDRAPDYPEFIFKPFADFKEDRVPTYTLRHGGVGRWDEYNAWERYTYLIRLLSENYKQTDLLDEAAGSLSLEEIHQALGKKLSDTRSGEPTKDIYLLLHAGLDRNMRVRVHYWTSMGNKANGFPTKSSLRCISRHKTSFDPDSLLLLTSPSDGRAGLSKTEQLGAIKHSLLSRERIVTREDVKSFCTQYLKEDLRDVAIEDGVGLDERYDFGMTRVLKVTLRPTSASKKKDWDSICNEVRGMLEQQSTLTIPIQVLHEMVS